MAQQAVEQKKFSAAVTGTITTALGTVAALTWVDAIRTLFTLGGIFETQSRLAPWLIAVAATLLAIWGSRALAAVNAKVASSFKKKAVSETEDDF